ASTPPTSPEWTSMKSLPTPPLDPALRLGTYLTVALACLCLGVAEQLFLPGIIWLVGPVLALLAVAYLVEGRWSLPAWAANLVGVVIAVGWLLWVVFRLLTARDPWLAIVPLPTALLPRLLLLLIAVKAFSQKPTRELWLLQGLGLLTVGLGCVLAGEMLFGMLLAAYLVCALWWLAVFYLRREQAGEPRAEDRRPASLPSAL